MTWALPQRWSLTRHDGWTETTLDTSGISRTFGSLTAREHDVLVLTRQGLTAKAIARRLGGLSPRTVDTHRANAFRKLGVNSIAALAAWPAPMPADAEDDDIRNATD